MKKQSQEEKQFQDHENKCDRCGRCCKIKIQVGEKFHLGGYCPFVDDEKMECSVYDERFKHQKYCLTVLQAMMEGGLPEDCAYTQDFPGYVSVVEGFRLFETQGEKK